MASSTPTFVLTVVLFAAAPVAAQDALVGRPLRPDVPSWAKPVAVPQPQASSATDPSLPDAPAAPIPVDGGLGLLAAAGAAYAARRLRDRSRARQ